MAQTIKLTRTVAQKPPEADLTGMYLDFCSKYRNVYISQLGDMTFMYRALGRSEYREILGDNRFDDLKKEDIMCAQCLLYPDPDTIDWDEMDAGIPSVLLKEILQNSFLDSIEHRTMLHDYFRSEMYDLDNQITCIINEAFPNVDIEEIERWDVEKTTKYLSRAEWKLHHLRGLTFVAPELDMASASQIKEEYNGSNMQRAAEREGPQKEKTIRGGKREDKLTPDKMQEREEFLRKFPEFANDDILNNGVAGLAQPDVDVLSPALRVGR